jgi:hypothetical protein
MSDVIGPFNGMPFYNYGIEYIEDFVRILAMRGLDNYEGAMKDSIKMLQGLGIFPEGLRQYPTPWNESWTTSEIPVAPKYSTVFDALSFLLNDPAMSECLNLSTEELASSLVMPIPNSTMLSHTMIICGMSVSGIECGLIRLRIFLKSEHFTSTPEQASITITFRSFPGKQQTVQGKGGPIFFKTWAQLHWAIVTALREFGCYCKPMPTSNLGDADYEGDYDELEDVTLPKSYERLLDRFLDKIENITEAASNSSSSSSVATSAAITPSSD